MKAKAKAASDYKVYIAALHNIFLAMNGLRIFERFGFNLPLQKRNKKGVGWL